MFRITATAILALLLAFVGALGLSGETSHSKIALWAITIVLTVTVAIKEIIDKRRFEHKRDGLTGHLRSYIDGGERIEYEIRDDPQNAANFDSHFRRIEAWRDEVIKFLDVALPGSGASARVKSADGDYDVGELRWEATRLRRQRENLANILDNIEGYMGRSKRHR